ncbi:hypothetical protein HALA3H3_790106 [Halomonas sp. A3H3]|nr:hypothetical protein HALA3H3_790106 [Halomonas sp. A3H3]
MTAVNVHRSIRLAVGKTARGALAQLGERNTGSVEVSGSIPLGSTNKNFTQY